MADAAKRTHLEDQGRPVQSEPLRHHVPILVRCLIEHKGKVWQAFSLEFGLAVQGESEKEVRHRLETVINSYIYDALVGEDREHAEELMSRRATGVVYLKYFFQKIVAKFRSNHHGWHDGEAYRESLALEPRLCSP
jgi:hypothetical protein